MIFSVLSSLVIIEPLIIFRKFFTGFFFAEQTVIQNAHLRIMCILFFEPLCSFYEIPAGVLRGTGHSLSPAIAAIIGTCCFRIIWIYTIFGEYCQLSVLYYAFPISWILTIVLIMIDFAIVIKNRQPLKQNFMLNCKETMVKKKRIVIRLILFRCAKHSILPRKTGTREKRVPSSYGQNSIAQSHKMQYL